MLLIADDLDAIVVGDDCEIYEVTPYGHRLVTDHEPPTIVEYHRNADTGEFREIVRQRTEVIAHTQNDIEKWYDRLEKIATRVFWILISFSAILVFSIWAIAWLV